MLVMWVDSLLCFVVPRAARWTAVVVDRHDGQEYPIRSVRFRWRLAVNRWVIEARERARWTYVDEGGPHSSTGLPEELMPTIQPRRIVRA